MNDISFRKLKDSSDRKELKNHFLKLSPEDRRNRFFSTQTDAAIQEYVKSISFEETVWVGAVEITTERFVGAISLTEIDSRCAEVALSVEELYRDRKIGSLLMTHILPYAQQQGYDSLKIECLQSNHAMQALAKKEGFFLSANQAFQLEGTKKLT